MSTPDLVTQLRKTNLVVSLRAIAVGSAVLGIASLGVLVVVTSVEGAEALSTVALALAIIAFVVQIVVFIVQATSSSAQAVRAEELHGKMVEVLAEMREKVDGTQATVSTINERMLSALIAKYSPDVTGRSPQSQASELAEHLVRSIPAIYEPPSSTQPGARQHRFPPRRPTPLDAEYVKELTTYPEASELGDALSQLSELKELSRLRLKRLAEDEVQARAPGSTLDPALTNLYSAELLERGLVEPIDGYLDSTDEPFVRLTDKGRAVARLVNAKGATPDYLHEIHELMPDESLDRNPEF